MAAQLNGNRADIVECVWERKPPVPQGGIALQYGPDPCAPDPKDDGSGRRLNRCDAASDTRENETD